MNVHKVDAQTPVYKTEAEFPEAERQSNVVLDILIKACKTTGQRQIISQFSLDNLLTVLTAAAVIRHLYSDFCFIL